MSYTHALPPIAFEQNTIFLEIEPEDPWIDWQGAACAIDCFPGVVAVAMEPPRRKQGSILIPDSVNDIIRSDMAIVLASGVDELAPGDRVGVLPYSGKWFGALNVKHFSHKGLIRMIGVETPNPESRVSLPWFETIPCKLMVNEIIPLHDYVLIRRHFETASELIEIPDEFKRKGPTAEVLAVGEGVHGPEQKIPFDIQVGDTVIYWSKALITGFGASVDYGDQYKDCALIRAGDLLARIR